MIEHRCPLAAIGAVVIGNRHYVFQYLAANAEWPTDRSAVVVIQNPDQPYPSKRLLVQIVTHVGTSVPDDHLISVCSFPGFAGAGCRI
jgi:hypothetical protein